MKTVVTMSREGRLTVPEELRQAIQIGEEAVFEIEVKDHTLILHPTDIPPEDAWAYTPEHLERVKEALQEGEGRRLSPDDLERLIAGNQTGRTVFAHTRHCSLRIGSLQTLLVPTLRQATSVGC